MSHFHFASSKNNKIRSRMKKKKHYSMCVRAEKGIRGICLISYLHSFKRTIFFVGITFRNADDDKIQKKFWKKNIFLGWAVMRSMVENRRVNVSRTFEKFAFACEYVNGRDASADGRFGDGMVVLEFVQKKLWILLINRRKTCVNN